MAKAAKAHRKKPSAAQKTKKKPAAASLRKKPARSVAKKVPAVPIELQGLRAYIVNLERRPDRWKRVAKMLRKETPWLEFERFLASDGTKNPIPEAEVVTMWNSKRNAIFADWYEWVYDEVGTERHGKQWMWAADTGEESSTLEFTEDGETEFVYINDAPGFASAPPRTGTVKNLQTSESFKVKLEFAQRYIEPGIVHRMSGGERGCAHSHLRLWNIAAEREQPTLVLEDDAHVLFDRTGDLGQSNGKVFTDRLALALKHAPKDFDVIYLGWSGWRDGHNLRATPSSEDTEASKPFIRRVEYVWTTVAYVISQAGAKKLLAAASPMDQPVDNFMAWEANQGRLKSYVAIDQGDDDSTWAGGLVDQFDFQGDTDIKKSDGGHQGDDADAA